MKEKFLRLRCQFQFQFQFQFQRRGSNAEVYKWPYADLTSTIFSDFSYVEAENTGSRDCFFTYLPGL